SIDLGDARLTADVFCRQLLVAGNHQDAGDSHFLEAQHRFRSIRAERVAETDYADRFAIRQHNHSRLTTVRAGEEGGLGPIHVSRGTFGSQSEVSDASLLAVNPGLHSQPGAYGKILRVLKGESATGRLLYNLPSQQVLGRFFRGRGQSE